MTIRFAELDRQTTAMGEISLRRRLEPTLQIDVYEVKLGDEHLMSNLFTAAEIALADLGLAAVAPSCGAELDVVVGGLGLGYTARAALADPRVRMLDVVEAIDVVIDWHRRHLLPLAEPLTDDARCNLVHGDFFAAVASGGALGPAGLERYHAVLLDIDHTPDHVLHGDHAPFYRPEGLARMAQRIHPGGVFALWSDHPDAGDEAFLSAAREVFATVEPHVVTFPNHHTGRNAANTVYVATVAP